MADLELVSTEELIKELFDRKTFAGVLVYSANDHKFANQVHSELRLVSSADTGGTLRLLVAGLEAVEKIA